MCVIIAKPFEHSMHLTENETSTYCGLMKRTEGNVPNYWLTGSCFINAISHLFSPSPSISSFNPEPVKHEAWCLRLGALLPALLEAAFGGSGVSQHQPNTALKEEQNWSWHSSTTDLSAQLLSHLSLTSLTSRELLSSDIKCMLHSWVPHRSQLLGEPWR